jgi:predicted nucleic acid-binding Zn ribbon protein
MRERQCVICGRTFLPAPPRQAAKTCSKDCEHARRLQRNRESARRKYAEKKALAHGQQQDHRFPCPWASGSITAPECLGVDPWLGF